MNRNTRVWGGAVAVLAVASVVAGCSTGGGGAQDPDGEITGTITVTSIDAHVVEIAAAFEEKYPGTKVEFQNVTDVNTIQQQIRTQLTSGTAPDVFTVWPGNGSPTATQVLNAAGDFLYDLGDRPWVADMPEGLLDSGSFDGTLTTALYAVNGIGAVYNMEALEAAGLTAPATWTELLDFCAAATDAGKIAFALGAQDQWITQLINYALVPSLVYSQDSEFDAKMASGETTFAESGWADAFAKYQEMQDSGCFNADVLSVNYATTQTMVASGEALGVINGNWVISELRKANPDNTYTLFPVPATDNPEDQWIAVAAGAGLAVNQKTENLPTALAFVDFYMSPEGLGILIPIQGGLPAYAVDTVESDDALASIVEYMAAGKTAPFMDQNWPNAKVQSEHLAGMQDIFAGNATAGDILDRMQAAYDEGE